MPIYCKARTLCTLLCPANRKIRCMCLARECVLTPHGSSEGVRAAALRARESHRQKSAPSAPSVYHVLSARCASFYALSAAAFSIPLLHLRARLLRVFPAVPFFGRAVTFGADLGKAPSQRRPFTESGNRKVRASRYNGSRPSVRKDAAVSASCWTEAVERGEGWQRTERKEAESGTAEGEKRSERGRYCTYLLPTPSG